MKPVVDMTEGPLSTMRRPLIGTLRLSVAGLVPAEIPFRDARYEGHDTLSELYGNSAPKRGMIHDQ